MASSSHPTLFLSLILFSLLFLSPSHAETSLHPHAILLPVQKDPSSLLYTIQLNQTKHQVPKYLTLDLGGRMLWETCTEGYAEATHKHARLPTSCSQTLGSFGSCSVYPINTFARKRLDGTLGTDVVSIQSTDGINPGSKVSVPRFFFVCAPSGLLEGLPSFVTGMAGLANISQMSLPLQFSSHFNFNNVFAICLRGTTSGTGVIFFGPGPYHFLPNYVSTNLIYTPLLDPIRPGTLIGYFTTPTDYFIGVTSIKINQKTVPDIDASLLDIDYNGHGGTKISTLTPYTVLETSIYNAVTNFFESELFEVPTVPAVAPFGLCFNSTTIGRTQAGPDVPEIDLVLQEDTVYWAIYGANSMVQVSDEVLCLAFVDGGMYPTTSIVIGGYQLEDNLLQFDLGASMLGFSSSLLRSGTTCANFNFTSNA